MSSTKAISAPTEAKSSKAQQGCLILFGLVFCLAGLGTFVFAAVIPVMDFVRERGWDKSDATVISSVVDQRMRDSKPSFSINIKYRYSHSEREWTSNVWRSHAQELGNRLEADRVLERFPEGQVVQCYVNPANPDQAVLDRSFPWSSFWGGIFALVFFIAGLAVIGMTIVSTRRERLESASSALPSAEFASGDYRNLPSSYAQRPSAAVSNLTSEQAGLEAFRAGNILPEASLQMDARVAPWQAYEGPQRLQPLQSKLAAFLILLFVSLFWNGISWTIFLSSIREGVWIGAIFTLLFVGIGLLMVLGTIYSMMQLLNPKVSVAMSNGAVTPGESVDIAWEVAKNSHRLQQLELTIVGEEVVTYIRGTNRTTESSVFQRIPVASVTLESEMRFGSATVELPKGMVHTFNTPNNEIRWSIEVVGEIRWWPDIYQKMVFGVCPALSLPASSIAFRDHESEHD